VELPDEQLSLDLDAAMIEEELLAAERDAAVRAAFAELPRGCRELLAMLVGEQPNSYEDISATLGMRVGSIGPMRARCLDRLRQSPHIAAVADGARDKQARGKRGD
jgi:DNA-directed RNA polymerase specialized sigma24 family protein